MRIILGKGKRRRGQQPSGPVDAIRDAGPRCQCGVWTIVRATEHGVQAICPACSTEKPLPFRHAGKSKRKG